MQIMINIETALSYLTFGGVVALGLLYNSFLKKYTEQKGKNLAEKEDLEEITTLVKK